MVWPKQQFVLLVICITQLREVMIMFDELYKHWNKTYPQQIGISNTELRVRVGLNVHIIQFVTSSQILTVK